MQELKINVETPVIGEAFKNFIINYRTNVADYMNQLVANDGSPCDSEVVEKDGVITVYHIAPDKGFVLGQVDGGNVPFQVMQYKDLAVDKRYLLLEQGRFSLFIKQEEGDVDIRLGSFKTMADAAQAWDSEAVKGKMAEAEDWKKAKKKEQKRLQKLGKLTEEDSSQIEEAQVVDNNG